MKPQGSAKSLKPQLYQRHREAIRISQSFLLSILPTQSSSVPSLYRPDNMCGTDAPNGANGASNGVNVRRPRLPNPIILEFGLPKMLTASYGYSPPTSAPTPTSPSATSSPMSAASRLSSLLSAVRTSTINTLPFRLHSADPRARG